MGCGASSHSPNNHSRRSSLSSNDSIKKEEKRRRKIEEEKRDQQEKFKRDEDERKKREKEEEAKKMYEEEIRIAEEARRIADEDKQRAEEERRQKEERQRREEEEEKRKAEEERQRRDEEEKKEAEKEEKAEEERQRRDEEEKKEAEKEEKAKEEKEEEVKKETEERMLVEEENKIQGERVETAHSEPKDEEEDETPLDDDGYRDSEGYSKSALGLMIKSLDFRKQYFDDDIEQRPQVTPEDLYTDREFPLEIAIVEDHSNVEWKRPKEFIEDPCLFAEGTTRFDVGQGSAGTCWFLSTVANIAEKDIMLQQVIPEGAYKVENDADYDGVFHARFYRFGRWEDVYVDDYLPVIYGNVLWGAKSSTAKNEMWVALLEKAFAKLYGSYDAIYGGQPGDAYLLLTGGIGERIDLEGHANKASSVYQRIYNAIHSGCQVSCVVPDEYDQHMGLVGGHAYSLVGTAEVGNNRLIRVRNPWGHGEWKGAWSDGSAEWSRIQDSSINVPNSDDGEFFVSLEDFLTYFSQTTICSLTPDMDMDGTADSLDHVLSVYGEWCAGYAGGFRNITENPRFTFTLNESGVQENGLIPFVVQIIQQSEKRKTDNISMRCDIFRVLGDTIKPVRRRIAVEIEGTKTNVYSPELQATFRHWLRPGRYLAIPSTLEPGQEKAFMLRFFTSHPVLNVNQLPMNCRITSCENESSIELSGKKCELTFEKTLFGEFQAGRNAGGQVSHQTSYHKNPQYRISVPNTGSEVPVVIHIMQDHSEPQYPVGIRLFKLEPDTALPVDVRWLYDNYNSSPCHMADGQSQFMISWDVDVRYLLPAGTYVAMVHLDEPDTEKEFSIVFKSNTHIGIKGYQT